VTALSNAKHEAFARAIVEGKQGREAYRAAGYSAKPAAAETNASRLLRNAQVSARIDELKAAAAEGAVATARQVLEELTKIGLSNMQDYMRAGADGDPVLDFSKLSREQAAVLQEVTVESFMDGRRDDAREVRKVKFKLADKIAALVALGRHHKLFTDKHQHHVKVEVKPPTDFQRARGLAAFIAGTKAKATDNPR